MKVSKAYLNVREVSYRIWFYFPADDGPKFVSNFSMVSYTNLGMKDLFSLCTISKKSCQNVYINVQSWRNAIICSKAAMNFEFSLFRHKHTDTTRRYIVLQSFLDLMVFVFKVQRLQKLLKY